MDSKAKRDYSVKGLVEQTNKIVPPNWGS